MEDPLTILKDAAIIIVLVLLNGFFVAAEFAMVKVRSTQIEVLLHKGHLRARYAAKLLNNLDAYLSACQLGITLASLGLGWFGQEAVADLIAAAMKNAGLGETAVHITAFMVAFAGVAAVHIIIGELLPKSLAVHNAGSVTLWTALPLLLFYRVMYPFIFVLHKIAQWLLKLGGVGGISQQEAAHDEEEIRILLEKSRKQGYIDDTEMTYVDKIFSFTEKNVREIMVPRADMVCLYTEYSFSQNLEIAIAAQRTRYPVCRYDKDNILGFVHIKDMLERVSKRKRTDIRDIIREITVVPQSMPINRLLEVLQKKRHQIAVVIDEYGGSAGLVTIEDIIEEIVGDIQDEFDKEQPVVEMQEDGSYVLNGLLLLTEANQIFGINLSADKVDTLGGWMATKVDMPPRPGQKAEAEEAEFIIAEVDNMRIAKVLMKKKVCLP